mgnify:CR=1 FL=1
MDNQTRWLVVLTLASILWFAAGYNTASPRGRPTYAILKVDRETGRWKVSGWPLLSDEQARRWIANQGDTGAVYHVARICTESYLRGGCADGGEGAAIAANRGGKWTYPAAGSGEASGPGLRTPGHVDPSGDGGGS